MAGIVKEHPRYNVISFRLSDEELQQFEIVCGSRSRQETMNLILSGVFKKVKEATSGR